MKHPSTTCSCCSRRRGLTLIEVVAAIAILGTLLVGVVLAKSRHTRQLARAQVQSRAVVAADELISRWWVQPDGVPIDQRGDLGGLDGWVWHTRLIDNAPVNDLGARVVRLEVHADSPEARQVLGGFDPLFVVDLVVPDPEEEASEDDSARERADREGGDA